MLRLAVIQRIGKNAPVSFKGVTERKKEWGEGERQVTDLLSLVEVLFQSADLLLQVPQFGGCPLLGPHCLGGTHVGFLQLALQHHTKQDILTTSAIAQLHVVRLMLHNVHFHFYSQLQPGCTRLANKINA